jgi:hypothetical protein
VAAMGSIFVRFALKPSDKDYFYSIIQESRQKKYPLKTRLFYLDAERLQNQQF